MELKKCFHCNAERPIGELKYATISFRENRRNMEISAWFCKDKPCQYHEQMCHEM